MLMNGTDPLATVAPQAQVQHLYDRVQLGAAVERAHKSWQEARGVRKRTTQDERAARVELGRSLLEAQKAFITGRGVKSDWGDWLAAHGIDQQRASDWMNYARKIDESLAAARELPGSPSAVNLLSMRDALRPADDGQGEDTDDDDDSADEGLNIVRAPDSVPTLTGCDWVKPPGTGTPQIMEMLSLNDSVRTGAITVEQIVAEGIADRVGSQLQLRPKKERGWTQAQRDAHNERREKKWKAQRDEEAAQRDTYSLYTRVVEAIEAEDDNEDDPASSYPAVLKTIVETATEYPVEDRKQLAARMRALADALEPSS